MFRSSKDLINSLLVSCLGNGVTAKVNQRLDDDKGKGKGKGKDNDYDYPWRRAPIHVYLLNHSKVQRRR